MRSEIKRIGVLGAEIMGQGISQVTATNEFEVILTDITNELVQNGKMVISKNLYRLVEKRKLDDSNREKILGRVRTTTSMEEMEEVDFVIEAVSENEQLKLDKICKREIVLSTNIFNSHYQNCLRD